MKEKERERDTKTQSQSLGVWEKGLRGTEMGNRMHVPQAGPGWREGRESRPQRMEPEQALGLWDPGGWTASLTRCPLEPRAPGSPRSPCGRQERNGVRGQEEGLTQAQGPPRILHPEPPHTHSFALLSWVAGDPFGSSGA